MNDVLVELLTALAIARKESIQWLTPGSAQDMIVETRKEIYYFGVNLGVDAKIINDILSNHLYSGYR